jgi:hypothetical protein
MFQGKNARFHLPVLSYFFVELYQHLNKIRKFARTVICSLYELRRLFIKRTGQSNTQAALDSGKMPHDIMRKVSDISIVHSIFLECPGIGLHLISL